MTPIPTLDAGELVLRPMTIDDAPEVQRLAGDRAIAEMTLRIPHPYEDGMAEQWIATHGESFDKGEGLVLGVTCKDGGALVGTVGLTDIAPRHQAELGYWIGVPWWNRGYCTRAALALLNYAFHELGLVRVHASHLARNPASGRVMRKIGMHHEGRRRQHVLKWDRLEDLELYGILKTEFQHTHPV